MTDTDLLKREFPDFDPATLPPIPAGFSCEAWHNNTVPTWMEGESDDEPKAGAMQLGIDYADPTMREDARGKRFFLHVCDVNSNPWIVADTDDWGQIETAIAFVRYVRDLGLAFHVDTRGRDYVGPGDFGRLFTDAEAGQYDATVSAMHDVMDPYEAAIAIWSALGLVVGEEGKPHD